MDVNASLMQKSLQSAVGPETPISSGQTANASSQAPVKSAQELAKVDTNTLKTETEKFDHYKQLIEAGGGKFNSETNAGNIVSVRTPDSVDTGHTIGDNKNKMGTFNDKIAVLWTDAEGKKHVKEVEGNVDPARYYSETDSDDANDDGKRDAGRLQPGFWEYKVDQRTKDGVTQDILRPVGTVMVERDMNQDGLFNDAGTEGSLSSAGDSILFHPGGNRDTFSAGCQTIKEKDYAEFYKSVSERSNKENIGYTLVQKED